MRLTHLLSLALFSTSLASTAHPQSPDPDQVRGEPADASEVRERIADIRRHLAQIPDRGAALYILATSEQHLGQTREALKDLKECLALREGFDPDGSPALHALTGTKEFDDLVESVHREFPIIHTARIAFATHEKDLVPEGLAFDPTHSLFYLSSLYHKKILKITADGKDSDFVPADRDHLLPILGIRPDPSDHTIWANSWDEDSQRSELLQFAPDGTLLARFSLPSTDKHGFNDLVIRRTGEIFLTDSVSNQIYRFDRSSHAFMAMKTHRQLAEPNGITLSDDDHLLFVADDFGVIRIDLSSSASSEINPGPHNTVSGIDGLYFHNGALIAVQNGIGSCRIAAFRLSKDATRVMQTTILENRTASVVLPTTGAIRGNDFYFIVDSQIDNLNGSHLLDVTRLRPTQIAVVHLP